MKYSSLLLKFLCIIPLQLSAQISFIDATQSLLIDTNVVSYNPIGVVDMNGDGLDDIIRIHRNYTLSIDYQKGQNELFDTYTFGKTNRSEVEWSVCIGDVDNNGFNDILVGGYYNRLRLLKANETGTAYDIEEIPDSYIFAQVLNFVDIDNDGFADIFACHDEGLSPAYRNDGAGNFVYDTSLINTASIIPSDNSGNYASIWTDYDDDGDLDMYLSKCSQFAMEKLDGRRVNLLFQNDGDGNFTEVAEEAGLRPLEQSWAADFADIDNDGDLDCFLINHFAPSQLFENQGDGTFQDVTDVSGLGVHWTNDFIGFHCKFEDFDNDGFVDLLFGADRMKFFFFHNNGDGTFTNLSDPFSKDGFTRSTFAIGDLNDDGLLDIYAAGVFDTGATNRDKLFLNQCPKQNFLKVLLQGTSTNTNAIGAKIKIYGDWGVQVREVRSGESYGVMNSFTKHFGLGAVDFIDSLIVQWSNGTIERLCGISANQTLRLAEGAFPSLLTGTLSAEQNNLEVQFGAKAEGVVEEWRWDFGDGNTSTEQNPTHRYAQKGDYTVILTISNGCEERSLRPQRITIHEDDLDIILSPNPVQDLLSINTGNKDIDQLLIYDSSGQLIIEQKNLDRISTIDCSSLATGIYQLCILKGQEEKCVSFKKL
ncbi:MAG: FG-GAP-like repeat-containing protein [Bacteroidota bacterium]